MRTFCLQISAAAHMNKPFMQSFIHIHDCLCYHVHDECVALLCSFFLINVGCLKDFEKHSIKTIYYH